MENNKALALLKENELIKLAKDRNSAAFEELVKRNQARIYNLGLKLLGNKEDAADLLQETFINAYYALPKFEGKSAFSTWLYRIATNNAFMKMRKKKIPLVRFEQKNNDEDGRIYPAEIADWSGDPKAHLQNEELKALIEKSVNSLPGKYKTIFVLHDIEGFSTEEISKMLGLSVPAVKSRIHRSRMYLRDKLSEYFNSRIGSGVG
ncbi:MAG TPA: sigma-70 family RNA polymerase sigma factor [Candidatus Ratteibacteria bacterium]|jgi:RNA polymerase sigma-70 factor (ECF subfamily)|uniref:ECF RNA polymerase sigma factor SigW n=1 Tax=candidate division TA06 bacterium ADurb.Bin131 TaxID=1852827 RepID=A0A1V6C8K5_UNCT6|nr:MAG: ECF RNA polymerase sigma factor SigW [candidate division TA06 bacterium ADurb.Bin131]HOC02097.1 sigma-70 family RNA polymerase sigma factor [bacterium]HRS06418.1 sigma-70 family RNA polymerase sigma factor [Candidatus Ratteibacteria bacterium]HON05885.1 sigma-70 family RNA polymerase sigma factor [bacterium]HPC30043.1 sigma-70 family RNA polymerase sigma factor [bacterium]